MRAASPPAPDDIDLDAPDDEEIDLDDIELDEL
jgi:hypothetical protein